MTRSDFSLFLDRASVDQLRAALRVVDTQPEELFGDEHSRLQSMRREILIELDARGVKEVTEELKKLLRQTQKPRRSRSRGSP